MEMHKLSPPNHFFIRQFIVFVVVLFISMPGFSQTKIDSIQNVLKKKSKDTNYVKSLIELGILYSETDTSAAIKHFRDAERFSKILKYQKGNADATANSALMHQNFSEFEQAVELYTRAAKTYDEIGDSINLALVYNRTGNCYKKLGNLSIASDFYKKSLNIREKLQDKNGIAGCLNNIGLIYELQGKDSLSLKFFQQSLNLYEENNDKGSAAMSMINIGGLLQRRGDITEAIKYYEKSLSIYTESKDVQGQYECYINIGLIHDEKNEYEEALKYLRKALEVSKENKDDLGYATSLFNIGNTYENQEKYSQALDNYNKAQEIFTQIDYPEGIANCLLNIGSVYAKQGKYKSAVELNLKAIDISKKIDSKDNLRLAYKGLFENYQNLKDYKNALDYYIKFKDINDSIYNVDNAKKITQMDMQYQFDQKQKQQEIEQVKKDERQKAKLDRQRLISLFFVIGFLLMIALAAVIFKNYKQKQKDNILLTEQKAEINLQKDQISENLKLITHQKNEITSSIHYAQRIQRVILPPDDILKNMFSESFIFFRPRDIVSGDFYWFSQIKHNGINVGIVAAADCTGHGVPGAFMSMLGISFLNEIVNTNKITQAHEILNHLRQHIKTALRQTGKEADQKDGMDIALCSVFFDSKALQYAGAHNSMYLVSGDNMNEYKADRMPIGVHLKEKESFTLNEIQYQTGDMVYLASDGFEDQFGGTNAKKFMSKNFRELLLKISRKPFEEQAELLENALLQWRGNIEQLDDVLVLGFKL